MSVERGSQSEYASTAHDVRDLARGQTWVLVSGDGRQVAVDADITIGRGEASPVSIQVVDGYISRRHCRVSATRGRLWLEDLRSANGTEIRRGSNLIKADPESQIELRADDVVVSGTTVLFRVESRAADESGETAGVRAAQGLHHPDAGIDSRFLAAAIDIGNELIEDPTALRNLTRDLFPRAPEVGRALEEVVALGVLATMLRDARPTDDLRVGATGVPAAVGVDTELWLWALDLWDRALRLGAFSRADDNVRPGG